MPNRTPTPKKTTTQRGYGSNHRRARDRLILRLIDGTKCPWCKRPMFKDARRNWDHEPLHAHHPNGQPTRNTATELRHATCNKKEGKPGTREHLRPGLTTPATQTDTALEPLIMAWPQ